MRKPRKPIKYLLLSIVSLFGLFILLFFFPPTHKFSIFPTGTGNFQFSIIYCFFILIFLFFFSVSCYFFKNKIQGLLIGFFVLSFLIFHLIKLTHPFFLILLIALFFTLELLLISKKQ